MAQRTYKKDDTGELEELARFVTNNEPTFAPLVHLNILFAFVDPPAESKKDGIVNAQCRKLTARERDYFGFHVAIEVADILWRQKTAHEKQKLMWHELNHILTYPNEGNLDHGLDTDKAGRIRIDLREHDLDLGRFEGEIRKFGPDDMEQRYIDGLLLATGKIAVALPPVVVPSQTSSPSVAPAGSLPATTGEAAA